MDMRRFGGSGQRADFGSNEDAYVFNALNNALYIRFMPQKVHIRALLLLGYLQPLQTFLRCNSKLKYDSSKKFAHRKLQSSFSHDDTMMYRADAPICSPSGQYPILWDPQYVILKPFTCSISLLCLVGQNNYFIYRQSAVNPCASSRASGETSSSNNEKVGNHRRDNIRYEWWVWIAADGRTYYHGPNLPNLATWSHRFPVAIRLQSIPQHTL